MSKSRPIFYRNAENIDAFHFQRESQCVEPGVSAMLRVKNEATKIWLCLTSIYDVFDEIVLVDNASTDQTASIVHEFIRSRDDVRKIRLYTYPFNVSRCGEEHAATPENSVHSLVYYYNWTLSKCTRSYVCKWDADMIFDRYKKSAFIDCLNNLKIDAWTFVRLP